MMATRVLNAELHLREEESALAIMSQSQRRDTCKSLATTALSCMPTARLLLSYPPGSKKLLSRFPVIPLNRTLYSHDLYAFVQSEEDADVTLPLPALSISTRKQTSNANINELHITFDTKSNMCYLDPEKKVNKDIILFTKLETGIIEQCLSPSEPPVEISTGTWRISANSCMNRSSTIDILVLERQFTVEIFKGWAIDRLGKRKATGDLGRGGLAKRQKGAAGETIINPRNTFNEATAVFLDLKEGNSAVIRSLAGSVYRLSISERILTSFKSQVYKCLHSKFLEPVAAKVFCYTPGEISQVAKRWKEEKKWLQLLKHVSTLLNYLNSLI